MVESRVSNKVPMQTGPGQPMPTSGVDDGSEYFLKRNSYNRISCSKVKDEVGGEYLINFNRALPQFDTPFCKAYEASSRTDTSKALYCVILDKRSPIRLQEVNRLIGTQLNNFANVVAAQVVPTSIGKGRSFAIILEKPKGITLSEYLINNGKISEEYVAKAIVPVINALIVSLSQAGVVHGRINAGNVYIDDNNKITIGECVSEPCGYSQPILYETISRAASMPIGKGTGTLLVDYYALGVLVAILMRGESPVEGMSVDEVLARKFEEGTYSIVTTGIDIAAQMLDLLRGVLNERKSDVWGTEQMHEWIKGRRFNLLAPTDHVEAGRAITFNNTKYMHRRHLAHAMYLHWDEAKKFVKQDTIIKWIDRGAQDDELVEYLEMVSSRYGREKELPGFDRDDELLSQYILLLDPTGPVRLRDFAANIDGLGTIFAYGFAHNRRQYIDALENIILRHLLSTISSHESIINSNSSHDILVTLQKCNELIRKVDLGFGIERCLYELSPVLSCQSPAIIEDLVFTKEELLLCLENNESIGGKILDRHMAGFLSERMELQLRIHISTFTRFPEFATNVYIQVLALLSLAQQTGTAGELPKLSDKVYDSLKNVIEEFYSKSIREELHDSIAKAAKKGILANLLRIISSSRHIVRDRLGFKKAVSAYKNNSVQVVKLSNAKIINTIGYRYGLQLAVMISFFLATVEIMTLMIKAF